MGLSTLLENGNSRSIFLEKNFSTKRSLDFKLRITLTFSVLNVSRCCC
jgi:hypothetical protein